MDKPIVVSAGTIQTTLFAFLRVLGVLIGGFTAIVGFLGKHDLAGLTAYIRSDDFTPVAGAIAAVVSLAYGMWKTHQRKAQLLAVEPLLPNSVMQKTKTATNLPAILPFLFVALSAGGLVGCTTLQAGLNQSANVLSIAQRALRSAEALVAVACYDKDTERCEKARRLLAIAQEAEAVGLAALAAGNAPKVESAAAAVDVAASRVEEIGVAQ